MNSNRVLIHKISDSDMNLAETIAHGRNDRKESGNIHSFKIDERMSEFEAHKMGALGEIAVTEEFGTDADDAFYLHGDGGFDLRLKHFSVSVKTRGKRHYDFALYSTNPEEFTADLGILVVPETDGKFDVGDNLIIRGWTDKFFLWKFHEIKALRNGVRLYIPQEKMFPIKNVKGFAIWPRLCTHAITS